MCRSCLDQPRLPWPSAAGAAKPALLQPSGPGRELTCCHSAQWLPAMTRVPGRTPGSRPAAAGHAHGGGRQPGRRRGSAAPDHVAAAPEGGFRQLARYVAGCGIQPADGKGSIALGSRSSAAHSPCMHCCRRGAPLIDSADPLAAPPAVTAAASCLGWCTLLSHCVLLLQCLPASPPRGRDGSLPEATGMPRLPERRVCDAGVMVP
jgi:hypothetical protein